MLPDWKRVMEERSRQEAETRDRKIDETVKMINGWARDYRIREGHQLSVEEMNAPPSYRDILACCPSQPSPKES
jgi:hypothetical protein